MPGLLCGTRGAKVVIIGCKEEVRLRLVRFSVQGKTRYGILENAVIRGLSRSPFARPSGSGDLQKPGEIAHQESGIVWSVNQEVS